MAEQPHIRIERQHRAAQIIDRLRAGIVDVLAAYPVEMAYLYGSVARGCPLPSSDIDIALVLTEMLSPYRRLRLELEIQAALENACGLSNVDVRAINHAPLTVQGRIIQEGLLLYERDKARRVTFEALIRRRYFDYQPTAERMRRAFLDHVRRKGLTGGRSQPRLDLV
ncbi:MAG TPA: nucleotidyltransferase domain-containing protein [Anaerolineae bacterium]|nr:nucleotidyltransferase domain-containing protein [Anaerolineae bacterium]